MEVASRSIVSIAVVAKKIQYKVYAVLLAKIVNLMRESHVNVPHLAALHHYALPADAEINVGIGGDRNMNAQQIFRNHLDRIGVQKDMASRAKPHQAHAALLARKSIHYRPEIRTSNQSLCRSIRLPEAALFAKISRRRPQRNGLPCAIMVRAKMTAPPGFGNLLQIGI